MIAEEAERILRQVTYKPGWKIRLLDMRDRGWSDYEGSRYIEISVHTDDAVNVGHKIDVVHRSQFPLHIIVDEDDFMKWLLRSIDEVEKHEAREFLKLRGRAPFYPH